MLSQEKGFVPQIPVWVDLRVRHYGSKAIPGLRFHVKQEVGWGLAPSVRGMSLKYPVAQTFPTFSRPCGGSLLMAQKLLMLRGAIQIGFLPVIPVV